MSEIQISCDPSGKDASSTKIAIIGAGRSFEYAQMIRNLETRQNIVIIDDLNQPSKPNLEAFQNNYKKWIEYYFPNFSEENFTNHYQIIQPARSYEKNAFINALRKKLLKPTPIRLKVKKRYVKCPKI